jgi:Zn-finger nucleic acid-binding protein
MRKKIICPTCKQDMKSAPHEGLRGKDCPQCGQGISWRRAIKKRNRKGK